MLRARLTGLQSPRVFDRIAVALRELGNLYTDDETQSTIEEIIAGGGLVVGKEAGAAYWESRELDIPPRGKKWQLLVALAEKAQLDAAVGLRDVYGDSIVSDNALSTTWNRLKECLPASLHKLVHPGSERRSYKLKLDRRRIHIISTKRG
jgi:hypothetical protein